MKVKIADATVANCTSSHFGPEANIFHKLEQTFCHYGDWGGRTVMAGGSSPINLAVTHGHPVGSAQVSP